MRQPTQPTDAEGVPRLMEPAEFREALGQIVAQPTPPLFGVITLKPSSGSEPAWDMLRERVRLEDGDLVAREEEGRLAVYLSHVDSRTAKDLVERIAEANGGGVELLSYPGDQDRLASRFGLAVGQNATGLRHDG